ncbi:MAG: NAD(P)H-dependent oxidoreductase [Dysosmobacter sp.]
MEHQTRTIWLYEKNIQPCIACRACQRDWSRFGCVRKDDADAIFQVILESELMVLTTPIYSWYCTPPMKALLDRLVYGMNKYYGEEKGPALWEGKAMALLMTCGYRPEKGCDLFEEGMRRYCRHSVCGIWAATLSGTWDTTPSSCHRTRRSYPGLCPAAAANAVKNAPGTEVPGALCVLTV